MDLRGSKRAGSGFAPDDGSARGYRVGCLRPGLAARPVPLAPHEPHPSTSHTSRMDKTGIKGGRVVAEYVKLPRWPPRGHVTDAAVVRQWRRAHVTRPSKDPSPQPLQPGRQARRGQQRSCNRSHSCSDRDALITTRMKCIPCLVDGYLLTKDPDCYRVPHDVPMTKWEYSELLGTHRDRMDGPERRAQVAEDALGPGAQRTSRMGGRGLRKERWRWQRTLLPAEAGCCLDAAVLVTYRGRKVTERYHD